MREHRWWVRRQERDRDLSFFPLFPWHIILQRNTVRLPHMDAGAAPRLENWGRLYRE